MKPIRYTLLLLAGLIMAYLVGLAYSTGVYVGDLRVRTDAMHHLAGYYDTFGDGRWHWGKYGHPLDASRAGYYKGALP